MVITYDTSGRIGNQMLRYAYGAFLAKNNNLKWKSNIEIRTQELNTTDLEGRVLDVKEQINDENASFFIEKKIDYGVEISGFFQDPKLLHHPIYAKHLNNIFQKKKSLEIDEKKIFVHVRAGDIDGSKKMLPFEYYDEELSKMHIDGGYIATDSPNNEIVKKIQDKYKLCLYLNSPIETIIYGSNFKKIILSLGSFSLWIGLLASNSSEIISITMDEAINKYCTTYWHPSYSLKEIKKYANN